MKKYKKILIISYIIMNCFTMTSCFSYKDVNKVLFATSLIIDVDDDGNPLLYVETFKGARGTTPEGTDERIIFK
jgi:spore germination protein KC